MEQLRTWRWGVWLGALVVTLMLSAGCAGGIPSSNATSSSRTSSNTASAVPGDAQLYVSLGDSYAAGYQPDGRGGGSTSRDGFAYQVADKADDAGLEVTLVNYGCAGVTSTTMVEEAGCAPGSLGPGAPAYPDHPQAVAALALMKEHPAAVRLVTIAIGGNDLQSCLFDRAPQACVEARLPVLRRNLDGLLTAIRSAVGGTVPVVGITYPDVYLGLYLKGDAASVEVARRSRKLFRTYLNPTLKQVYAAHGAAFVDVTTLTGAYGSLADTQHMDPYGQIPTPVAKICRLTWFCSRGDVHPNRQGYGLIAAAVLEAVGR